MPVNRTDKIEQQIQALVDRNEALQPEIIAALWLAMRGLFAQPVSGSWLEDIRRFKRLSAEEVGKRLKKSRQNVLYLEKAERQGRISLGNLKNALDAIGFDLAYTVVPKDEAMRQALEKLKLMNDRWAETLPEVRKLLSVEKALNAVRDEKRRLESINREVREVASDLLILRPGVMKQIASNDPSILSWLREQLTLDTSPEGIALLHCLQEDFPGL
jgi:transcriptional regulator with XRE-family HTH domain